VLTHRRAKAPGPSPPGPAVIMNLKITRAAAAQVTAQCSESITSLRAIYHRDNVMAIITGTKKIIVLVRA
jgi:hypothetical protein